MKTIKFRIYDPINKKMIESGATPMMLSSFFENTATLDTVHGMKYQQFTGLHDKNGKEIYFGDILETSQPEDKQDIDTWKPEDWGRTVVVEDTNKMGIFYSNWEPGDPTTVFGWKHVYVVGNINENPELLEVIR